MKKIGMLFIALVFGLNMSYAQPGGQRNQDPVERAKSQTAELKEALGLNKQQEKKVYDLNLEAGKKMSEARQNSQGGGSEGMREKMGEIREEQNKKMKAILTDAQWVKYEKYQEERRARMRQRRGN